MKRRYAITEPAGGVFFVEGPASNWIILRRDAQFTLVDGGYRGDLPVVLQSIRGVGLDPRNAVALLITHAHSDHTGAAAHFAREYGTPVLSSAAERNQLLGREKFQVSPLQVLVRAWQPWVLRWGVRAFRAGGTKPAYVPSAAAWKDEVLREHPGLSGLPGFPVTVPTPGHTPGHTAFHLPGVRAVITGDALVTGHPISTRTGPQLLHPMFQHDGGRADGVLSALAGLDASLILPGHGPALSMGIDEAVDVVRSRMRRAAK